MQLKGGFGLCRLFLRAIESPSEDHENDEKKAAWVRGAYRSKNPARAKERWLTCQTDSTVRFQVRVHRRIQTNAETGLFKNPTLPSYLLGMNRFPGVAHPIDISSV